MASRGGAGGGGASAPGPGPVVGGRASCGGPGQAGVSFFLGGGIGSQWGIQDFDKGAGAYPGGGEARGGLAPLHPNLHRQA